MKKLIRAAENQDEYPVGDWLEDSMFRNMTPEQAARRIVDNVDSSKIKDELSAWILKETKNKNQTEIDFGNSVWDILSDKNVI